MKTNLQEPIKTAEKGIFFVQILDQIIVDFPQRSQEIVKSRYGVEGKEALTLEEIGKKYTITRERVRQVIREVFRKIKDRKDEAVFQELGEKILFTIEQNSGIMEEQTLLFALAGKNTKQRGAVRFFLDCLEDALEQEIKGELKNSFTTKDFELILWRKIKNEAKATLEAAEQPLDGEELYVRVVKKIEKEIEKKQFFDFLNVSVEILKNNFDKWGLANWKEITPKGTREKAYLILKEAGKPIHFKEIAQQIDNFKLSKKKTHPQTVHNELIKDSNFVLVGRGIYALSEWGYKKGTVKDVLEEILAKSKKALSKDEIIGKVLEIRQVKKSTIIINLNNFFAKNKAGEYMMKK